MNVRIAYQDNQNWTDLDSKVTEWTNLRDLYKHQRVQPAYLAPEVITDTWNGRVFDVQHIRWNAWYLEFLIKESELQEVSRLQSCRTIIITDIDNSLYHEIDLENSEYLQFTEPERIADTSNWKVSFTYRQGKTIINKYDPLVNQVTLVGNSIYYSKYEKLDLIQDVENIETEWYDGSVRLLRETNKTGFKVLLYYDISGMEAFKDDFNQNNFTIDGVVVVEKLPLEINELGENNYQILVSVITSVSQDTKDLSPLNTNNIDIDSGTFYYTDYPVITSYENTVIEGFSNESGIVTTSKTISKKVLLVKLYLNELDAFNLKHNFEKSKDIEINSIPVLENRIVAVSELDYNLYECNVEGLIESSITYPLA